MNQYRAKVVAAQEVACNDAVDRAMVSASYFMRLDVTGTHRPEPGELVSKSYCGAPLTERCHKERRLDEYEWC